LYVTHCIAFTLFPYIYIYLILWSKHKMKTSFLWLAILCSSEKAQHFGGTQCLHLQGWRISQLRNLQRQVVEHPEQCILHSYHCENLKSNILSFDVTWVIQKMKKLVEQTIRWPHKPYKPKKIRGIHYGQHHCINCIIYHQLLHKKKTVNNSTT
jgi:hypothetical protein